MAPLTEAVSKPRLRGVSHQWAFVVSLACGVVLLALAPGAKARIAAAIYALTVSGLFGSSALYHRVNWSTPRARRRMRRLDHSMIFALIAGTYTPVALLALHGTLSSVVLVAVWGGALGGIVLKLVWIDAPKPLIAAIYVTLGWVALIALPQLARRVGLAATLLVLAGGLLYTVGAVIYARQRPDPWPRVFGYHEVFHALVIVAAALHYAVVAIYVLPRAS